MKAYTDLSQSKRLAEILPIESADMHYWCGEDISLGGCKVHYDLPCWSLAALIELLPPIDNLKPMIDLEGNSIYYSGHNAPCSKGNTLVDACVDMILLLKERNLI